MTRNYYDEALQRWDHPTEFDSNANFVTGYVIYSRNRDSSILQKTNFSAILDDLGGESDLVRVVRHDHSARGWIEYITVDDTAPDSLLDQCVEIARALADHPIYSPNRYHRAQWDAIHDHWYRLPLADRVNLCRDNGVSIFAARRDSMPDQVYQDLSDSIFV